VPVISNVKTKVKRFCLASLVGVSRNNATLGKQRHHFNKMSFTTGHESSLI
jgi:hypothetical protein